MILLVFKQILFERAPLLLVKDANACLIYLVQLLLLRASRHLATAVLPRKLRV